MLYTQSFYISHTCISFISSFFFLFWSCTNHTSSSQTVSASATGSSLKSANILPDTDEDKIMLGAEQVSLYLPQLAGKRVGMVVNHTSMVGDTHLVDTLLSLNIAIKKIFAPEHGFRGEADAGEHVSNGVDKKTNLPLVSLYGSNKKPSAAQLADLDVVIFDIQDVGARFYTYISTMHYVKYKMIGCKA